jgi:hypothetical protein
VVFIRDREDGIPERRIVMAVAPLRSQKALEELRHLGRDPGRQVDAIRDGPDRPLIRRGLRPERCPHLGGDVAMDAADGVRRAGCPDGERGHVEHRAAAVVVVAEREKPVAVGAERSPCARKMFLDEVERERIVAGGHGRVRREHRRAPHFFQRALERVARFQALTDPLKDDEGGVPLVEMPDHRIDAERAKRTHAADAENDLLLDSRFAVAAVQPRGQLAIPRRVLLEVGVEEEQPRVPQAHAPHRDQHRA